MVDAALSELDADFNAIYSETMAVTPSRMRQEHQQSDTEQTDLVETLAIKCRPGIALAHAPDLLEAIETQAEKLGLDPEDCGRRLATCPSPRRENRNTAGPPPGTGVHSTLNLPKYPERNALPVRQCNVAA